MEEKFTPPANSRFTDYPFRYANLHSERLEWLEKRNRAIRKFREEGDSSLAEKIGLFWNREDEKKAREAQRLRFSDNIFREKLTDEEAVARFAPILERRRKDAIKEMVGLFKPITKPHIVYRVMEGPLLTSEGRRAQVGDELWVDGFLSTSRHPGFAAECGVHEFGEGFVMLEIRPSADAETIILANESQGRREYETIFNVGQKVRVEKAITDFHEDFHPMDKVGAYYIGTLVPG